MRASDVGRWTRCSAERRQRRFPAPDAFDDAVGVCGPDEGPWAFVGFREEAVDGRLEIGDPAEDAAPEPLVGQLGEEAFDRVEPGGRGRREMEVEAGVPLQPGRTFGCLWVA